MSESQDQPFRSIEKVLHKIQEHIEAIAKYSQRQESKRQEEFNRVIKSEVRLPIELTAYYGSEQADRPIKNRRDAIRLYLELGGLAVAIVIVGLTIKTLVVFRGQLREMQTQTGLTDRNFRLDERAWISVTTAPSYATTPQGNIVVPAQVQNVGKTPARLVEGAMIGTIVKQGEDLDYAVIRNPHTVLHYPTLFQNISSPQALPVLHYMAFVGVPVTAQEMADGKSNIVAYGQITFDDVFGGHHWTHFCVSYPIPTKNCVQYNDTDAN